MSQFAELVSIAADQHGLLSTEHAVRAGVASASLQRWVADGRLERVAHGLYRVIALPSDRLTAYLEATMWANGQGAVSHASALEMLELCDVLPPRICITVPARYGPRKHGGEHYRVRRLDLPSADLTEYEGVPVVTVFRAIAQSTSDGEDPTQLRLAIRNAIDRGLILDREVEQLSAMMAS